MPQKNKENATWPTDRPVGWRGGKKGMMKITLSQVVLIRSEIVLANEGAIHFLKEWNTHQAKHHAHR